MPPNTSSGSVLDQVHYRYKQIANPYNSGAKNTCLEDCPGTSASTSTRDYEEPEHVVEDIVRVTTRARQTYELYRYSKNAMLIVHNTEVNELKTTFEKFRFEVDDVSIGLDTDQLDEICGQFFQRDFTDYGAVALAILTPTGLNEPRCYPVFENRSFEEAVIMDHFKLERNPTLADKPKIFITEMELFTSPYDHLNALDRSTHGDIIGFHCSAVDTVHARARYEKQLRSEEVFNGPMSIFCKKLAAMGDNVNLTEIIAQTITDSSAKLSEYNPVFSDNKTHTPFGVVNTLSKELYFASVEEN